MPKNNAVKRDHALKHAFSADYRNFFSDSALTNLKAYLGRVAKGQPNVYDTPFARDESTSDLLKHWNKTLVSIRGTWPSLYEFESDMAAKVGPYSIQKPMKDRMDDLRDYYTGILLPAEPVSHSAVAAVLREWNPARGIWVRDTWKTIELMKKSTNSGSPYFTKKIKVISETYPFDIRFRPFKRVNTVEQLLPQFKGSATAVIGWRGQEGGLQSEDVKQRVVWMFPFAVNIAELTVYQPLIEAAQRFNLVPAWVSMEAVDRHITKMFDTMGRDDLVVCTDFTKFDQHFNTSLSDVSKTLLEHIFNNSVEVWLENVFPMKYNIPIVYQFEDDQYLTGFDGLHGMGSGSGGTNADETLAHRALQYEAAQRSKTRLNPYSQCLGDDGILTYPGISADKVTDSYRRHGLEMNKSKQYESRQTCIYLRRWHSRDYRIDGVCAGVYSTMRALGRLRYLERYMDPSAWGPKAVALRQLSILENVKYHPLRDQFAEFCMKRDKYRLGIDIPGFLDNLVTEVKEAIDNMPDFMGYTRTLQAQGDPTYGINSWWIVRYLKSKA